MRDHPPDTCRKCGSPMQPGIAMGQTYTAAVPDFPGDREGITLSAGGPGEVIPCRKCPACGWSVTPDRELRRAMEG